MSVQDLLNYQMLKAQRRFVISTYSPLSCGVELAAGAAGAPASTAHSTANRAYLIPFYLPAPATAMKIWISNGAAVSGNLDLGIYDENYARLVSLGSTAQAGTATAQVGDITDTFLQAGAYYMAYALDNTTGCFIRSQATTLNGTEPITGLVTMNTAFPLPATVTPGGASLVHAIMGVSFRSFVV